MIFSGRASDSQLRLARHLVVFTTAVVCFGPAVPSSVAQTTGAIRGIVRNSEGQAVGAARVVVNRLGPGDTGVEIETEADGRFAHDGLESGFYTVAADKEGLGSESYRVRVRGGRTVAVNFLVESGRRVTSGLVDLFGAGVAARRTGTYSEVYRVRVRGGRTVEINFLVEPGQRVASGSVDPGKREALAAAFGAGVAASRAGAYVEAVAQFAQALELHSTCVECHFNVGVAYSEIDRFTDAEAAFKRAIDLRPDYTAAYYGLANVYRRQNRPEDAAGARDEAHRIVLAAIETGRVQAADAVTRGIAFLNAGNTTDAQHRFEEALRQSPGFGPAHYWLGVSLMELGAPDQAAAQGLQQYLSLEPNGEYSEPARERLRQLER